MFARVGARILLLIPLLRVKSAVQVWVKVPRKARILLELGHWEDPASALAEAGEKVWLRLRNELGSGSFRRFS